MYKYLNSKHTFRAREKYPEAHCQQRLGKSHRAQVDTCQIHTDVVTFHAKSLTNQASWSLLTAQDRATGISVSLLIL